MTWSEYEKETSDERKGGRALSEVYEWPCQLALAFDILFWLLQVIDDF